MRKRTLAIAGAVFVVLLGAGVPVGVHCAADASWAEMERIAARLERQWTARDFARPALGGPPLAESPFGRYARAMDLAQQLTTQEDPLGTLMHLYRREPCDAAAATALCARWQPVCDLLLEGARCTDARPPIDWSKGFDIHAQTLLVMRFLVDAVCVVQRQRLAAGDPDGAVDLSLAAQSFAAVWLRSPLVIDHMIAVACDSIAVLDWRDEDLRALPAAALRRLGDGLAAIDGGIAASPDGSGEVLLLARHLQRIFASPPPAPPPSPLPPTRIDDELRVREWRFCWSERWLAADAVCVLADALDEHPAVAWPDWVAQMEPADEVLRRTANPLVGLMVPCRQSLEQNWRDLIGCIRLLRVAIALHLGEELLVKDPFACGSLTVERQSRLACVAYTSPDKRPRQRLVQLDTEPARRHR